ncbi:MAG: flagellar basal body protein [Deltaproteobacteria bacterium]|nr:flagellar basal body protein [Deltaproteobacteria bacterium]
MSFSIGSNLSALQALGTKMAVTADNVANVSSDAFKKSRAVLEEGENGAVKVDIQKIGTPGPVIQDTRGTEPVERELSNVDLAEELPRTIPTGRGYEANLKIIQTRDEMLGTVIDLLE